MNRPAASRVAARVRAARLWCTLVLLSAAAAAAPSTESATALLDYAAERSFDAPARERAYRQQLARAEHEMRRHPLPATDCARTLGSARFAALLDELGDARSALGDHEGAVEAYERALGCHPRAAYLHADLAYELMAAGRHGQARATALGGLAIEPDDAQLVTVLARLDFVEENWTSAIERLRASVRAAADDEQATYWQCFLWLAQRRAGIRHPRLAERELDELWPAPVLDTLKGSLTEEQLVDAVRDEPDELRNRELLVEALYYVGQKRLALGERKLAERYLAAAVDLKVLYFIEHHMAVAELAKLRGEGS